MTKLVSNLFLEVKEGAAVEVDLGVSLAGELILSSFFLSFFFALQTKKEKGVSPFSFTLSNNQEKKGEKKKRRRERE